MNVLGEKSPRKAVELCHDTLPKVPVQLVAAWPRALGRMRTLYRQSHDVVVTKTRWRRLPSKSRHSFHTSAKNRDILGGTPVFRGTRVPVQGLFDDVEQESARETGRNGLTPSQVLRSFVLKSVKSWDLRELRERIADGYTEGV